MIAPPVKTAIVLDAYVVRVVFADGEVRDVDIEPLLEGPVFEALRDPHAFEQVGVDEYGETIMWPNGADLDPDVLRYRGSMFGSAHQPPPAHRRQLRCFERQLRLSLLRPASLRAGFERDKGDDVLDLTAVDLADLAQALEDHSYDHSWWLDPKTGEVVLWSDYFEEQGEPDPEVRGLRPIDPVPSHEGYEDMQDFIDRVRDPQARRRLERAIEGRGAFRRFKDTLLDFPELREAWFRFHDARIEQRAIQWLAEEGLVDEEVAERAIAERPDPELPELSGPFDPHELARQVAQDLRGLYSDRLRKVLLFGSWARGDAHPESDIDLLVVLDQVDSTWEELRRMDALLWRHSFANDTVVTALPVAQEDVGQRKRPVVVRAETEGLLVG